ncbi:hypothetical protein OJ967_17705 [Peribacillus frigoritolerans]|uniref:hypothetical protein n=1 Tax=Peribacillus frigoritolerans TaxID=450367 RepID=UPI002225BB1B|nr:hypothetical protein [Peribacillus frigoritolerans]UYY97266.1 hypothetical protein OJ967_17705 [Peribacillus frigoritolerans]
MLFKHDHDSISMNDYFIDQLVPACKMEIKEGYRVYKSSNCICAGLVHFYHSVVQKVRTFRKWWHSILARIYGRNRSSASS